jgi:isopentenyl-diphosphate delta-isomerase
VVALLSAAYPTVTPPVPSPFVPERPEVMLVDEAGNELGVSEKRAAHEPPGHLHLAFSVFLFRRDGRMLVQQRSEAKYHFPGIWANACCSHPEPGEDLRRSAERRVLEELGIRCSLRPAGSFVYRAVDPVSGLVEHELDHVFVGLAPDGVLRPAPDEVQDWRAVEPEAVVGAGPAEGYAPWFSEACAIALREWRG